MAATGVGGLETLSHDVLVVGHGGHVTAARGAGLEPRGAVHAALNRAGFARSGLRRYLRKSDPHDVVHAWSWSAAELALEIVGDRALLVSAATPPTLSRRVLRRFSALGGQALAVSSVVGRRCAAALPDGAVAVLVPPVSQERLDERWREALRDGLGLEPGTFVVGLLGEPITGADAEVSAHAAGRLMLAGRDVRLLMHPASARRADVTRLLRRVGVDRLLIPHKSLAEPWRVVAALDAALLVSRGATTNALPALWAMAAAVPVIAERSEMTEEVLADGRTGWLVPSGDYHAVADRLLDLVDDRAGARRLGDGGRDVAATRHDPGRFAQRLGEAYEQAVSGERIRLEDEPPAPVVETRDMQKSRV
jgi:glycosyltransferase involved in cell wall biosynthesis